MNLLEDLDAIEIFAILLGIAIGGYLIYECIQDASNCFLSKAVSGAWLQGTQDENGDPSGFFPTIGNWLDSVLGTCIAGEGGSCS